MHFCLHERNPLWFVFLWSARKGFCISEAEQTPKATVERFNLLTLCFCKFSTGRKENVGAKLKSINQTIIEKSCWNTLHLCWCCCCWYWCSYRKICNKFSCWGIFSECFWTSSQRWFIATLKVLNCLETRLSFGISGIFPLLWQMQVSDFIVVRFLLWWRATLHKFLLRL